MPKTFLRLFGSHGRGRDAIRFLRLRLPYSPSASRMNSGNANAALCMSTL